MGAPMRFIGLNFDHMHMGDLLRQVRECPDAEIVGICDDDPTHMADTVKKLEIPPAMVFTHIRECIERTNPDIAILCPATGRHAEYVEIAASYGLDCLVEKPFAATLADADRMIAAVDKAGKRLVVNWPLAWYPPHRTAKRLVDGGRIGDLLEVHYYDGNRGPLRHIADKDEVSEEAAAKKMKDSWWYRRDKGGGSLLDYLGYGTTLGTWYQGGRAPLEVTCTAFGRPFVAVDEHSVAVARYAHGLSTFSTRWGTFTDPWVTQPQPKCGFVLVGTKGTIASYDYEATIRVQDAAHPQGEVVPVDTLAAPHRNPIEHVTHCFRSGEPVIGPLDPAICRIGQQVVDTAFASALQKKTLPLLG